MNFEQLRPYVRYARRLICSELTKFQAPNIAYDHRLFFCLDGKCPIETDWGEVTLYPGDVFFIRSGITYRYLNIEVERQLIAYNFDFTRNHTDIITPFPPCSPEEFRPELILEKEDDEYENSFFHTFHAHLPEAEQEAMEIEQEYRHHRLLSDERISLLMADLLVRIYRVAQQEKMPRSSLIFSRVTSYLREHYMDHFDNQTLGEIFSYHPNYLNKLIREYTGLSLHHYLNRYRIDRAMTLLQSTDLPVAEIGRRVGFDDLSHFSKTFQKLTGYAPSAYRMKI